MPQFTLEYPPPMPWGLKRFQQARCLHFITFSCFNRAPLLSAPRSREIFEETLERARGWYGFYVSGYVVMPEHVHLLITEPERGRLSLAIQMLKQNVARELRAPEGGPFWLERYYDFNVWTEKKRIEKLRYMHRNPVKRGLVARPQDWPWSSFCHYVSGVEGAVEIESQWTARKRERFGFMPQIVRQDQSPRPVSANYAETRTGHPRERG
jgi:putative transposase